ncbi:MAG: hypothetical protein R3C16_05615 [Hyphomonadaceae bacterium]
MLEIDVNVRRFAAFFGNKALEHEMTAVRIHFGDAKRIANGGIRRRAAALAKDWIDRIAVAILPRTREGTISATVRKYGAYLPADNLKLASTHRHPLADTARIPLNDAFLRQMLQSRCGSAKPSAVSSGYS